MDTSFKLKWCYRGSSRKWMTFLNFFLMFSNETFNDDGEWMAQTNKTTVPPPGHWASVCAGPLIGHSEMVTLHLASALSVWTMGTTWHSWALLHARHVQCHVGVVRESQAPTLEKKKKRHYREWLPNWKMFSRHCLPFTGKITGFC